MPGLLHQAILWLFEDDPWLGLDVAGRERPVAGTPIDRRAEVERDAPQLFKIHRYFPDLVLVYVDPDDSKVGIVITVEAQCRADHRQRYRIPVCQALLADKHELQTWAVVVSLHDRNTELMRSWADGPPPRFDALVLATDNVPRITSLEQARVRPTLTALSAALHGCKGDLECVRVAIAVFRELPEAQRHRYTLAVLAALPEREFEIVTGEMEMQEEQVPDWDNPQPDGEPLWEIEARSGLAAYYRRKALAAHEQALAANKQALEANQQALEAKSTLVEMILALLEARGIAVDDDTATRIRSCSDLLELERWARRAREVRSAAELFST